MPVSVVDLIGRRIHAGIGHAVQSIGGMHLRLPEVAPGAGDSLLEQPLVEPPEPAPAVLVENVDEPGVAEKEIETARLARDASRERIVVDRVLPVGRTGEHEGFRDRDRAYAVPRKIPDHPFRVRKRVAVPVEVAHVALYLRTEPVEIENDGIQRDVLAAKPVYDVARLFLGPVAETRREVTECPAWRQRLPAGDIGVIGDELRVAAAGNDDVGGPPGHGLEFQHVRLGGADIEPAVRGVVEDDDVPVARQHGRQAVIHLVFVFRRIAIGRPVVERHAAPAPIHAEYSLTAAEQFLAVVERKAQAAHRLVGEVAMLLRDERQAGLQEAHADG